MSSRAHAAGLLLLLLTVGSANGSAPVAAGGAWGIRPELTRLAGHPAMAAKGALAPTWRKVGRALREVAAERASGVAPASRGAVAPGLRRAGVSADGDGRVHVAIRLVAGADRSRLGEVGAELTFADPAFDFVEAWVAVAQLEPLAALDVVRTVRPTVPPLTSAGSVVSQGDGILGADLVRAQLGVTGLGVTVGVLSDSVDGLPSAQASGDLPPEVTVLKAGTGAGEGTAMLEIVHDLAPGAGLAFYGPTSSGDMVTGIQQLAASGARVIVDDLTFLDQPHFEEGPIARTINALAASGVVYVTSAGNFAAGTGDRGHYEADYVSFGALGDLDDVHQFAPGSGVQEITLLPGARGQIFLQWSNPFGQAADDYDLFVANPSGTILATSDDSQDGDDVPIEAIGISNSGTQPVRLLVAVQRFAGAPRRLELYYAGGITAITPFTPAGSIAGNANAAAALTVASINAGDPGNDTAASYSSRGPCDLFFPVPESRAKPEVTAIDGVAVTGAAGFPSPFFGTSAAAPHVAAIAALMRSANPALGVADVRALLASTALDLGPAGFDFTFGSGRVQALAAVTAGASMTTTTLPGSTTTTLFGGTTTTTLRPGSPPAIDRLSGRLDGDTLSLSGAATDVDADVTLAQVFLNDAAGVAIANTGVIAFTAGQEVAFGFGISVTGLAGLPTAVSATVVLTDARGLASAPATAGFTGGDPGGPALGQVTIAKRGRMLKAQGAGFVRRRTRFEVNGVVLSKAATVKKRGTLAIVEGKPARLNLVSGPNRIRLVTDGLFSDLAIVNR